jgi:diguanylate cyclase (GGDEF)-like protein/PAS domain S-box-containing protein
MDTASYKSAQTILAPLAAAFVALVCFSILGLSFYREWSARAAVLAAAEVQLANLSRSMMQHAEDSVDLLDTGIVGIVSRLETDGTDPPTLAKLRKVMEARKADLDRIFNIVILDETGNFVATSGSPGPNLADREFFRHHQQSASRELFVGPPIQSKMSSEWLVTISRRFNQPDGRFGGVVFAAIGTGYFANYYRQFNVGDLGVIALMTSGGFMVTRSNDDGSYAGRDVSQTLLFKDPALQASSGVFYFRSPLDEMSRLGAYRRSDRFPLVVLASVQQDEALAPWRSAAAARVLFVLGLVAVIAVLGLYLVRQLSRGQRLALELAASEANFRILAEGSSDIVGRLSCDIKVEYVSPSTARIIGWTPEQLIGTDALAGINPEDLPAAQECIAAVKQGEVDEARLSYRLRHRNKSEVWVETALRATRTASGEVDGFIVVSRDITKQKDLEGKLETLAAIDGLTGLANRRRFDECLQEEWRRACRERTCLALLMIDVDHFKAYNDTFGHQAGDACLRAVARILAAETQRSTDLAARYGGEEFAILLPDTDAAACARMGERIRHALAQAAIPHPRALPFTQVTVSLGGATCWPAIERSAVPASLIEAADRVLYAAKHGGRDRLVMAKQSVQPFPAVSAAR